MKDLEKLDFNIFLIGFMGVGKSTVSKALQRMFAMDVVEMDEIIANGYNLNIPRYVDTSEEEEQIDIAKVRSELAEITTKKLAAIDKVNSTLKLLGL